jgi:transposase-like protein
MPRSKAPGTPPFCPNPSCSFHVDAQGWRYKRKGFYERDAVPRRIQRYVCQTCCHRSFSSQTFSTTYWLRRPALQPAILLALVACSGFRQIARSLGVSPSTVLRQTVRLGRHCLLFHSRLIAQTDATREALTLDGFETFEFSQYTPIHLHTAIGAPSHFIYGLTDSELRRKGRMRAVQKCRRAWLEARYGRPDPKAIEHDVAELLEIVLPHGSIAELNTDDHPAYPRALRRLSGHVVNHHVTPSRMARTTRSPLFPSNLFDLLMRHSSANHKRETIAFSKRRQSALERAWILVVWRNTMKSFSERARDATPAQRLGLLSRRLRVDDVLADRLFPTRIELPPRWAAYYRREVVTRRIPNGQRFAFTYAA